MFNTSENKKKLDQKQGLQQAISPSSSTTVHSSSAPGLPHPSHFSNWILHIISSHPNLPRALLPPGYACKHWSAGGSRKTAGQQELLLLVKSKQTFQPHIQGHVCCILYHHHWWEADTISSLNHVFPLRSHASWLPLPLDFSLDSQLHGSKVKSLLTTKV